MPHTHKLSYLLSSKNVLNTLHLDIFFAGPLSLVLSGGLGGVALWVVVYPIDSVKSRIQVMSMAGERGGLLVTLARVLRHEGA